jgi:hypothetical protein
MTLFDIDACAKATTAQKELLAGLDAELRFALGGLAAETGSATLSATLLLAIAAEAGFAAPGGRVSEEAFLRAARAAYAWARRRHARAPQRLAA